MQILALSFRIAEGFTGYAGSTGRRGFAASQKIRKQGRIVRISYRYVRPRTVVYVRRMGPYKTSAREAWRVLTEWLERRGGGVRARRGIGLFRDNPLVTEPDLLRYDACIELMGDVDADPEAGVARQTLPGGVYGVHTHVGSYDQTGWAFSQLHRELLPRRGLTIDYGRPFLAIYLNDPKVTPAVHRRTDLCIPVVPIRMPLPTNDESDEVIADSNGAACDPVLGDGRLRA
jgi:AraC family transcriptional regulator